jgi:succinate-semialdehyde dehydrogenase/glutarate-semialdehyde dehydrogenase
MTYATINPFTGELIKEFPNATDAEVTEAIESAHQLFELAQYLFANKAEIPIGLQPCSETASAAMQSC